MIKELLIVGFGSFLGGVARYLVAVVMKGASAAFPWATLTANITGCLLIGIICALFNRCSSVPSHLYLFCTVGFCGGFTTFSTFSRESLLLLQSGSYRAFFFYSLGSLILGIAAVMAGYAMVR